MNYVPWYDADGDKEIVWAQYGTRARNVRRAIREAKNKWHVENLALNDVCGGGAASWLPVAASRSI